MGKSLKGKDLGKGISQRKSDGLYVARFTNRFGKREIIYARTVTEITKKMRTAQYEDEKQLNVLDAKMTLDNWFDFWLKTFKKNCRNTTKKTYTRQYNHLRKELGWRKLSSLNKAIIQNAFNDLKTDNIREDSKAVLVDMLNCAVDSDLIQKNVAVKIKTNLDNEEEKERRILSETETTLLFSEMGKSSVLARIMLLALNTGMRVGEILGLCWDCVDFKKNKIDVRRTLCYMPNNGNAIYEFHKPKTKAGIREIYMTKEVKVMLLEQRMYSNLVNSRHLPKAGFEDLVFSSKTNNPINEANVRSTIRYYVDKINKKYPEAYFEPFTMHSLRHTFATRCVAKGMKPKTLQKILGHSSLQMTMDLYCHVEESTMYDEMGLLAEMAQ